MKAPDRTTSGDPATRPSDGTERVSVALGSNLGDREAMLAYARARIAGHPSCRLVAATEPEETAPIGPQDQPPYLNQMLALTTTLAPLVLLDFLQGIERAAGRVRDVRWGPRTLDCDIVRFGDREVRHARLVVPHPEIPNREFWQRELAGLGHPDATAGAARVDHADQTEASA